MASKDKVLMIFGLLCLVEFVRSHASSSSTSSSSEDNTIEEERAERRAMGLENEWQYEGIPIDFAGIPSRRYDESDVHNTTTTTTTKVSDPYNHPRYRRIFNPDELAFIEDFKFMAALLVNQQLWCGAVIIDSDKVLTAAHCLQLQYNNRFFREYVRMLSVRIGSDNATAGGEVYRVTQIFFHPNYKPSTLEFNVAMLKLNKNISFDRADPIAASIPYSFEKEVPTNKEITFLGWGSVVGVGGDGGAVLLQKVKLPVYNLADCQEVYGRELVTRSNFCAGYITVTKNVCNVSHTISDNIREHDAGGPAVMDGKLVGILSFSAQRCDVTDKPAVFTAVGAVAEWLDDVRKERKVAKIG